MILQLIICVQLRNLRTRLFERLDSSQCPFHIPQLPLQGEGKGGDGALHPLQNVDPQEMDEAFLSVYLTEGAFASTNLGAVFGVIGRLLVRQDVAQRSVGGKIQATDFQVDLADGAELPRAIHVGLDVDRLETLGETTGFADAVVFLDMLARPGDGEMIQQGKVIEP